ncbi:MAG: tetratricopeptide repeat protein [Bacteroidetes bacterium]|nr:tetratricopeptide repeat protein [Bacteroidota bacterium]
MYTSCNQTDIIERYLCSELSTKEDTWFKNELKSNPDFAKEVLLHKDINKAILNLDIIDLRSKLKTIETNVINKRSFSKEFFHFKWQYIAFAASITLLVSFGLNFMSHSGLTNDEIYNMYYQSYDAEGLVRSGNSETNKNYSEALSYYNKKDYEQALILFNKILEEDYSNISVHLYSGIANMETYNYKKAIESFQLIIDHQNNLYTDQAEWYLAICNLKMYKNDLAIFMFEKIAQKDSIYKEQAKAILKKL